jgi:hypothetical protein
MHHKKLSNSDWLIIEERFQKKKKLCSWKEKLLSVGGQLILINSVLTSLTMYMLSFFEVPRGVLKKLDYYRSRFFWQCDEHKKSIDSLSGVYCVHQKTLVVWASKILTSKTSVF